jgi:hypothetical protein
MKRLGYAFIGFLIACSVTLIVREDLHAAPGMQKWVFETEGGLVSSPTIGADGTIYVGSNDGRLYALTPEGKLKWKFETKGAVHSRPAVGADGTIYVGSWDQHLYAINPDGSLKWAFPTRGKVNASPTIGPDGTIYVGSWDQHLYAVNPDGSPKWAFPTGDAVLSTAAVAPDGTIYVGSWDQCLYAIQGLGGEARPARSESIPTGEKTPGGGPESPARTRSAGNEGPGEIRGIDVEKPQGGEEKVVFHMSRPLKTRFMALDGGRPRLVCDFMEARMKEGLAHPIEVKGDLIQRVRIGIYRKERPRVRVVVDLVSGKEVRTERAVDEEKGLFTLTVKEINGPGIHGRGEESN